MGVDRTSVDDVIVMEIVYCLEDLSYCLGSILFCKLTILAYSVKEFSASSQLRDDVILVLANRVLEPKSFIIG